MNINEIKDCIVNGGLITHGGRFHADDVFSTALLQLFMNNDNLWPQRVFNVPEDTSALVYDIGLGEFDHHQVDASLYSNGKKKAAFGLLSEKIIPELYSQEVYMELLDFIMDLDEQDNYGSIERTGELNPISVAVSSFNSLWNEKKSSDDSFKEAVNWSRTLLENMIKQAESKLQAKTVVENSRREDGILYLEQFVPWSDFVEEEIDYVIYPSYRGGFNIQVNPNKSVDLPKEWLNEKPTGCLFVHQGLFLSQFDTIEHIEEAIKE